MDTPPLQATPSAGDGRAARAHPATAVAPVNFHGGKRLTDRARRAWLLPNLLSRLVTRQHCSAQSADGRVRQHQVAVLASKLAELVKAFGVGSVTQPLEQIPDAVAVVLVNGDPGPAAAQRLPGGHQLEVEAGTERLGWQPCD